MLVNPRYHTFFDGTVSEALPFTRNDSTKLMLGDVVNFTNNNTYVYNGEYWELIPVTRYYTDFIFMEDIIVKLIGSLNLHSF